MRNLRDFYEKSGVDYDALVQRMMGKEALVEKYLGIFIADTTYSELERAMDLQDYEAVGFKAHTLKGIALNLNFEKLGTLCTSIVSSVRSGDTAELEPQFEQVKAEYTCIIKDLGN